MMTITSSSPESGTREAAVASGSASPPPQGWWGCILDVALVLWILRVPVATTAAGALLLGATPQAQDLFTEFLDLSFGTWFRMLVFVLVLMVAWALPTHYAARMLVDTDPQAPGSGATSCLRRSAIGLPRLLGFLTFLIVELAIWRSYANMPTLEQSEVEQSVQHALIALTLLVAGGAVLYLIWVFDRPRTFRPTGALGRLNAHLAGFWQIVSPGRVRGAANEVSRDIGRFVLAGLFVVFVIIFVFGGDGVARGFPRATAVPFILGGWLPFLSYVSAVGRRIRAPLIIGLSVLVALLATVLRDNHSVRRVASANLATVPLEDAVDLWMTENACNPKRGSDAPTCPRPIIVAAAGGASRAGFMMASTIGYFLDTDSVETARYGVKGLSTKDVRNRLFAISSVSGGSMGAVMVAAALKAAPPDSAGPPCARKPVDQWWGVVVNNWRDCFEALTSGDFLTADFLGFAFNDVLPFLRRDRAAVLEDSWRDRFHDVIPGADETADAASCQGLDCPFLSLQPRPGHWIPLLVLNGTSEATGGRILTTSLSMTYAPRSECPTAVAAAACPLFVGADSFHDLLQDDVRVSTAAHNSARFPFISPPGSIYNRTDALVDRIVDGGYFENYGALSAKELALAVHAVAPQLKPLVIVISNDPSDQLDPADDAEPQHSRSSPRAQANAHEVLTEVTAPIMTVANTRTAHGLLAVDQLRTTLHAAIKDKDCKLVIQVRIWPDGDKQLSMSWWESPLVQRQIHRQTEQEESATAQRGLDQNQNRPHLDAIWNEMQASGCAAPKANPA